MAAVESDISAGAGGPCAYEPDEDWLLEWLAVVEEDIARAQDGGAESADRGAALMAATDVGIAQANWLLHGSLPDLDRG